ncbi:MAG: hypothetical protein ABIJ47_00065, partial [Candidatus Bathyarchaeota archaeon]
LDKIIRLFVEDELMRPNQKPYVFEFRVELSEDEFFKIQEQLEKMVLSYEDKPDHSYEFIDYYFKPKNINAKTWISKKVTTRIRDWRHPYKDTVDYLYSKVEVKDRGYIAAHSLGSKIILKDDITIANEFSNDVELEEFMRITKDLGYKYDIKEPFPYTVYLEKMTIQLDGYKKQVYSMEVEFWITDPKDQISIDDQCKKIYEILNIDQKRVQNKPLQSTYWIHVQT